MWTLIRSCGEALWVLEVGEEGGREVGVDCVVQNSILSDTCQYPPGEKDR